MSRPFNFTIGATGMLISCIADIKQLSLRFKHDTILCIADIANDLFARLEQCSELTRGNMELVEDDLCRFSKHKMMTFYHLNAFIAATYIYLYQTLFDLPPKKLRSYVNEVFYNVQAFNNLNEGNCYLWPAFIAAVSAYEEEDIDAARTWLDRASKTEMGNRIKVRRLVEGVWRVRAATAAETGQELGSINVDLEKVMETLNLDAGLILPGLQLPPFERFGTRVLEARSRAIYCH